MRINHAARAQYYVVISLNLVTWLSACSGKKDNSDADGGDDTIVPTDDSGLLGGGFGSDGQAVAGRTVNVPQFADISDTSTPAFYDLRQGAVFWFGYVTLEDNSVDVRIGYDPEELVMRITVRDRCIRYDDPPSGDPAIMTQWDAMTVYFAPNAEGTDAYRLISQAGWAQEDTRLPRQASFHWDGSSWQAAEFEFTTHAFHEGKKDENDNPYLNGIARASGWGTVVRIPFSSLGLSAAPDAGTTWRVGLTLHDRDGGTGSDVMHCDVPELQPEPEAEKTWPEALDGSNSSSWAYLRYGIPSYTPTSSSGSNTVTIKNGVDGVVATDAMVGGGMNCGDEQDITSYFSTWGITNYADRGDLNVQNQFNLGDFPCFSRIYMTFPLDKVPAGKVIQSASLQLRHFGNSAPMEAEVSYIQIATVANDWDRATIVWNNAPMAYENFSYTHVDPLPGGADAVDRTFDVSYGVAQAYTAGQPLRLAFYSADFPKHSGKYFRSSSVDSENVRPQLTVLWGDP